MDDRLSYSESSFIVNAMNYYLGEFHKNTKLSNDSLNDYKKIIEKYEKLENQILKLRIKEK